MTRVGFFSSAENREDFELIMKYSLQKITKNCGEGY